MITNVVINQRDNHTWSLMVDGQEISDSVCGVRMDIAGAGQPAKVVLEFVDLAHFSGEAEVVIDDRLAEVLKRLGWTPPT